MARSKSKWALGFDQGYMCALATMQREHDQPTMVEDALKGNFLTVKEMRSRGIDEFDIDVLEPIVKEVERKRKL